MQVLAGAALREGRLGAALAADGGKCGLTADDCHGENSPPWLESNSESAADSMRAKNEERNAGWVAADRSTHPLSKDFSGPNCIIRRI